MRHRFRFLAAFCGCWLLQGVAEAQPQADTLYLGGPILTIDDARPRAEAVAVKDGVILAAGTETEVMVHRGPETRVFDLAGRTLLPGFVDSHGHVVMGGLQAMSANLLAPPDGEVTDIAGIQDTLRRWAAENADAIDASGLIIGFGYDESQLAEQRPPNRDELDAVSTDLPIIVVHQSGHFGVANSKALAAAGMPTWGSQAKTCTSVAPERPASMPPSAKASVFMR